VEAAGGIFFLNMARLVAEHFRGFRPEMVFHGVHMTADVIRQVDVVVFPDDKYLTACQFPSER
jgi:hypothetical protein